MSLGRNLYVQVCRFLFAWHYFLLLFFLILQRPKEDRRSGKHVMRRLTGDERSEIFSALYSLGLLFSRALRSLLPSASHGVDHTLVTGLARALSPMLELLIEGANAHHAAGGMLTFHVGPLFPLLHACISEDDSTHCHALSAFLARQHAGWRPLVLAVGALLVSGTVAENPLTATELMAMEETAAEWTSLSAFLLRHGERAERKVLGGFALEEAAAGTPPGISLSEVRGWAELNAAVTSISCFLS